VAAGGDGSRSWAWLRRSFRLHLALHFCEEERNEVAVLPLGDAITDGGSIPRHLEVLAERSGQLLTYRLGQIKDAAVNLADLLRGEGSDSSGDWSSAFGSEQAC
jgi:hypothetical protein